MYELNLYILFTWKKFSPRALSRKNTVLSPVGLEIKNRCTGEGQQQFSSQSVSHWSIYILWEHLTEKIRKNTETIRQNSRHQGQKSKAGPPQYEAEV
jgi:hypothetical protein